jgi:phosphatidylglycerol---prolipoprotein diacylglyceryl transferase
MSIIDFIHWHPSPEIFGEGTYIRWYGLLFAMGFFFAYAMLYHVFKKEKIEIRILDMLAVYVFLATVIGARLGHVFFYEWNNYKDHPIEILYIWEGGLASHGAGIAIIIALIIFFRVYKVNMWWLFDRAAMVIPITAAFVRFGNLMNSEIYGIQTSMPWGFIFGRGKEISANGTMLTKVPCHPTQLYEAFSYLIITAILYLIWRKNKGNVRKGLLVGIFLTLMFTARFFIEFLKIPQEKFENTSFLDMGQWLSIPFVCLGITFIIFSFVKKNANVSVGINDNMSQ